MNRRDLRAILWALLSLFVLLRAAEAEPLATTEAGGFRLDLLAVGEAEGPEGQVAPSGWQYLAVDLALENLSGATQSAFVVADGAELLEDQLFPYYPLREGAGGTLAEPRDLAAGSRVEGRLLFEVPVERGQLVLRLSNGAFALAVPLSGGSTAVADSGLCGDAAVDDSQVIGDNGFLRVSLRRHCRLDGLGDVAAEAGQDLLLVEGSIENLNTRARAQLLPLSQMLVLLQDGALATPQPELSATLSPGFADSPLDPAKSRDFAVAFAIPEDANSLQLVHPGQAGLVALILEGTPPSMDEVLAGPIYFEPLQIAVGSAVVPGEDGTAEVDLYVRNDWPQSVAIQLEDFAQLVVAGGYLHDPLPPAGGATPEFLPGVTMATTLRFDVPLAADVASLVFFGDAVPAVLLLDDAAAGKVPAALASSGDGGRMTVELLGVSTLETAPEVLVFDLRLALNHDNPAAVLELDPSTVLELHLDDGSFAMATAAGLGLAHRFGTTGFHPGQPGRGQLAFPIPEGRAPTHILLPFAQNPVRLDIPADSLPADWRSETIETTDSGEETASESEESAAEESTTEESGSEAVPAEPHVTLDKTEVMPRERLRIAFTGTGDLAADAWLGVIPADTPHGSEAANEAAATAFFYLDGESEGSFVTRAPQEPGDYEVRLHDSDLDGQELLAVGFTVIGEPPSEETLSEEMTSEETASEEMEGAEPEPVEDTPPEIVLLGGDWAAPGSEVTARVVLSTELPNGSWIGLVPSGVPHGDGNIIDQYDMAYGWINELPDGVWRFNAPQQYGGYDLRVVDQSSNGRELASASFTVSPVAPLGEVARFDLPEAINVAQAAFGAYATGGDYMETLFDGIPDDYYDTGYTSSGFGVPIVVRLDQAYELEQVRFLPWDLDGRTLTWTLEASLDGESWESVADSAGEGRLGWQEIPLDGRPWQYLRLTGTASSNGSGYYIVELEAYASRAVPASLVATPLPALDWPSRTDLALSLWGGRVSAVSSGGDSAAALTDGVLMSAFWQAAPDDPTPSLTFAFNEDQATTVDAVALEIAQTGARPRLVTVELSDSLDGGDWRPAGTLAVPPDGPHFVARFPAQPARRARLTVTAVYPSSEPVALAEVAILEQVSGPAESILPFYRPDFEGGLNIATYNLFGQLLRLSEEDEPGGAWGMLDGYADAWGWRSQTGNFPQEAVLGFLQESQATLGAVAVHPVIFDEPPENSLRRFEIWTSNESPDAGFSLVGTYEAEARPEFQIFAFPPHDARYVKLRALSNWGGPRLALGEFEVLEQATEEYPTYLPDGLPILNYLVHGGHMALAAGTNRWSLLTPWYIDQYGAWMSDPGSEAPIDLVFGFGGVGDPWFDRIRIINGSRYAPREDWVRRVKVFVSPDSPVDNFTQVADLTLEQSDKVQLFTFDPVQARYVRIRILENFGGRSFSLAEVFLPEMHSAERLSVLARRYPMPEALPEPAGEKGIDPNERNDRVFLATPLEAGVKDEGLISPPTDVDVWRVDGSAQSLAGLGLVVEEEPALRIALALQDAEGKTLDQRPLYDSAGGSAEFFWALEPGRYHFSVDRPLTSIAVLSDISPSTDPVRPEITRALQAFVEEIGEFEEVSIAGFCAGIDRASDFTNDREQLRAAVEAINYGCGGTDLYGTVIQAIDWLEGRPGTKAILLVTDAAHYGDHQQSLYAAWDRIVASGVRIYSIGYGDMIYWDISPKSEEYAGMLGQTGGNLLTSWADATGGTYYEAPSGEAIGPVIEALGQELRDPSRYTLLATLPEGEGQLSLVETGEEIPGVSSPRQIEIILDASGSMWGQIEGVTKIEIARDVIRSVVETLSPESEIALRAYGHRYPSKPKKRSCADSELVVPFGPNNHQRIVQAVQSIKPNGQTPIGLSLAYLSQDFEGREGHNQVILITDGIETCDPDPGDQFYPPEIVELLLELGYQMSVSVVGFDIGESETREFLVNIAETGRGEYFDASNTEELEEALRAAIRAGYEVRDSAGTLVAEGQIGGDPLTLPAGLYQLVLNADPPRTIPDVRINAQRGTRVLLDREGSNIGVTIEEETLGRTLPFN